MKRITKKIASILGAIGSFFGMAGSWSGCSSPKLYGPAPPHDNCCDEFNGQFYDRCMNEFQKNGECPTDKKQQ